MIRIILAALCFCSLVACTSANKVDLKYAPTTAVQLAKADAAVKVGNFVDSRGETKTWVGTIRGGFGNHLKDLDTNAPVSTVVEQAFSDALKARGVNVSEANAPYQLSGVIHTLIGDQVARREATVALDISVTDTSSGQSRFSASYKANIIEGSALTLQTGVLASVEDLRLVIEKALRQAVDKALGDDSLRAALQI